MSRRCHERVFAVLTSKSECGRLDPQVPDMPRAGNDPALEANAIPWQGRYFGTSTGLSDCSRR